MYSLNRFKLLRVKFLTKKAIITGIDQAVLSIVNFIAGIGFIYFSTPESYGVYTLYMGLFYLFSSAQNALINTPMIVLSPRMSIGEADIFRRGLFMLLLPFFVIVFVITSIFSYVNLVISKFAFIASFSICFLLLRDYFRTEEFSKLQPQTALKKDIIYSMLALIGLFILIYKSILNEASVFIITGLSALAITVKRTVIYLRERPSQSTIIETFQKSWFYSRWSLIGATSSWVQANTYIYVPFFILGTKEVGFLAAARLLLTPVSLLLSSWGNFFRPLLSKIISEESRSMSRSTNIKDSVKLVINSSILLFSLLIFYTIMLIALLRFLPQNFIPQEYVGIEQFVILWSFVYLLNIFRSNLSSYMQASLSFKSLAGIGTLVALLTVLTTIILVLKIGNWGTLFGLVIGEISLILFMLRWLYKNKKNVNQSI